MAAGVFVATAVPLLVSAAGPASAQAGGCGDQGLETATVRVSEPAAGSVVSSATVSVRGTASANLGLLNRVEVTLAGITRASTYAPSSSLAFEQSFDVSNVAPGQKSVRVVACGVGNVTGVLARGGTELPFTLQPPPTAEPTTTVAGATTTVAPSGAVASQGATSATTVAVSTTRPAEATSTTSATSTPPTTEVPVADARPEPVRPQGRSDAPLILTEADDDGASGPPLWIGAAVGISGGVGLLFSASSSRRRSRQPPAVEPVDPDLVEVR